VLFLEVLGAISAGVTITATIVGIARRVSRVTSTVVQPVRRWTPASLERSFAQLRSYTAMARALHSAGPMAGENSLDPKVLYDWGIALILTIASQIDRFSQGKSTLFVISERQTREFRILPQFFDGVFPLNQLVNADQFALSADGAACELHENPPEYRRWPPIPYEGTDPDSPFIASRVLTMHSVEVVPVKRPDDIERNLGTTHVMGIPLWRDMRLLEVGTPAVITVDFRIAPFWRAPISLLIHGKRRSIRRIEGLGIELKECAREFLVQYHLSAARTLAEGK